MNPTAQMSGTTPQMSSTLDPQTASLLAQLYPQQQSQQSMQPSAAPQPQQPQQPQENWLEKLLPTAGSILGGIGGSFIAPFAGSVGGAAVGGGLGRALENALTGKKVLQGNDLTSGLEGGAGQAVGFGLGKLAGGLLGKLTTNAGGAMKGAQAEADLASEFPDAALDPKMKENLNFGQSLNIADQAGIPRTAEAFANARGVATGSNGYLNGVLDNIVRTNGSVGLGKYGSIVDEALRAHPELGALDRGAAGMKPTNSTASGMKQLLNSALQQTGFGGSGTLSPALEADPDAALSLLRQVRDLGQPYKGSEPGTVGAAQGDVYNKVYQGLKDAIYNRPEINAAIKGYIPQPGEMEGLLQTSGGNQQLAKHLTDIVTNANTAGDILKPQAQFMDMGDAGERALSYIQNAQGTSQTAKAAAQAAAPATSLLGALGGGTLGKLGIPLGIGGAAMTGNPMMLAAALPGLLGSQSVKNVTGAVADKLAGGGVAKGISKIMAPALMGSSQFLAHSPDYTTQPTGTNIDTGNNMQPTAMQQPGQQMLGAQINPNQQLMQSAMIAMQDPYLMSSAAPLLQAATKPMQQAQTAEAALGGAQQAFQGAGGGQGMLGGLFAKLGGATTGGAAKSYAQQKAQLATVLTSLGIPASAIPDVTDTSDAAQAKWQTLTGIIQSMGGGGLLATVPGV